MLSGLDDRTRNASLLQQAPLFAGLRDSAIERLVVGCRQVAVDRGNYLFLEGDRANSVYVVQDGWIIILLTSRDGRVLVLNEMRNGDVFGENSALTGANRSATALVRDDTRLLEIPSASFLAALDEDPRLARRLLETAATRLSAGNQRESSLAFLNAGARIVRTLHTLDELDQRTTDRGYVTVSQDELAQRTGLTRQTVARFLGQWRRNGWLLTGRGRIMLLNREALFELEEELLG